MGLAAFQPRRPGASVILFIFTSFWSATVRLLPPSSKMMPIWGGLPLPTRNMPNEAAWLGTSIRGITRLKSTMKNMKDHFPKK